MGSHTVVHQENDRTVVKTTAFLNYKKSAKNVVDPTFRMVVLGLFKTIFKVSLCQLFLPSTVDHHIASISSRGAAPSISGEILTCLKKHTFLAQIVTEQFETKKSLKVLFLYCPFLEAQPPNTQVCLPACPPVPVSFWRGFIDNANIYHCWGVSWSVL